MKQYVMALDQGTTSSRCILFDRDGKMCSVAQEEFRQIFPKPGWVEHDPEEIWRSQLAVAKKAMEQLCVKAEHIAAIGITNQRETTIVWDKETGKPVYPAIVWQCRRTADRIDRMKAEGWEPAVRERTGLIPDAYFSGSKLAWILDHVDGARERARKGELLFGTVDTWLIWNLTGGRVHVTDYTNASRTMLFDIHRLCWDEELLRYFDIPGEMLPEVRPSSCRYGTTDPDLFGGEIPIGGAAGDQQAALFGQCCFEPGDVKNTYGTGCFLLMNTGSQAVRSESGLLTTIAAGNGERPQYALEGSVFVAGAAIQWLRDEMGLVKTAAESETCCLEAENTGGVYVVLAFAGLGAPYWNPRARGTVVGLTRGTNRNQFIRAVVESMAYQTMDLIAAMERDSGMVLKELRVDGGASANGFLLQFQADILGKEILRPDCIETTALGAAYLAGLAVGYWKDQEEIRKNGRISDRWKGRLNQEERKRKQSGWKRAVQCALFWAEQEEMENGFAAAGNTGNVRESCGKDEENV